MRRKSFCVAGAILSRRFNKMSCSFRGRRNILDISVVIWRGRRSTSHSPSFTSHSTLYTLHSTLYTLHSTLYTPHFTLYTLRSTLHTLHSTLCTPHSTLYTLTPYTPHSTFHTLHFTLYTPHFTFYTLHFTLLRSTLHTLHSTLRTLHSTLYTPHFTLYTPDSTLHTPRLARHWLPYSTVYGALVWQQVKNLQDCSNKLLQKSVLSDCISMCFDICTINTRVSIRVRGLQPANIDRDIYTIYTYRLMPCNAPVR